jgi:uncharacterized membrane protein YbhN (UPF0104 family)
MTGAQVGGPSPSEISTAASDKRPGGRLLTASTLWRTLALILGAASIGYVAYVLLTEGPTLLANVPNPRYELVAAALGLYTMCLALGGLIWHQALAALGHRLEIRQAVRLHLLAAPARYLPGLGGQYLGKVGLVARAGVPPAAAAAAALLEFTIICAGGVIAGLALLPFVAGRLPAHPIVELARQFSVGPAVFFALASPLVVSAIARHIPGAKRRDIRLGYGRTLALFLGASANWLLVGLSVFLLGSAAYPIGASDLLVCQFAVAASLLAGLVALTPMGLGVREGALTLLLGAVMGPAQAAVLAIAWRLVSVVADGLGFAAALAFARGWARAH